MADSNFEGTNLLGGPFKPYVDEQVAQRQTRLGGIQKSQEEIVWQNAKSAYLALASSVNIENSAYYIREERTNFVASQNKTTIEGNFGPVLASDEVSNLKIDYKGTNKLRNLDLPEDFLGNKLANNLVLFGGTAYFKTNDADENGAIPSNEYSNPYYRSGLATSDSLLGNSAYGFGGTSFGLSAMPGLTSFNIKSKNMGSLREASITIRANNKEQFSLIDSLYCRIGYTMFMEWGNSIYFNNDGKYVSNPNASGVTSLLPIFLSGTNGNKSISDNPSKFLKLIEDRREKSNGNYDAFFGKVKNFSWEFNPAGYYEISLSLISQGDIIESLNIDGQYGGVSTNLSGSGNGQPQPNESSALTSFLTTCAAPNLIEKFSKGGIGTGFNIDISNNKNTLLPLKSKIVSTYNNKTKSIQSSSSLQTPSDTIESLNYTRLESSVGKIVSAQATFGSNDPYFYVRLGDILDFVKDRLLVYTSRGDNEPILDINTDTDKNVMYNPGINVSADPSKVMVRTGLPYTLGELKTIALNTTSSTIPVTENIFEYPGAEIESWESIENPNDPTEKFPLHGKIMNIYFEYQYLLSAIKGLRNEKTGTISLYDFVDELCQTVNNCLGGVNKLSIRLEDDRVMKIYDQTPIYGTQNVENSLINLYGINPTGRTTNKSFRLNGATTTSGSVIGGDGSFVTDFNIKTELTNDFAIQVTIGAQAQSNNVGSDTTGLSAWNSGFKDRFYPEKIDSLRKDNGTAIPTTQERIDKIKTQLSKLWLGYSQGSIRIIKKAGRVVRKDFHWFEDFDTKRYSTFVKLQKDWLQEIIKLQNENFNSDQVKSDEQTLGTNQIGMIPINISVTLEGISGIRIYDKLEVDTRFLPDYYPQTLIWIIKGVSHEIQNNKWYTKLETIAVPKLPQEQNFDAVLGRSGLDAPDETLDIDDAEWNGSYGLDTLTQTTTGIINDPTPSIIEALKSLDDNILIPITNEFGTMLINSAYRNPAVNSAIGGSTTSQHQKGEAVDFDAVKGGKELNKVFTWIAENLTFGQLIWEKGNSTNPRWIHVSYSVNGNKGQLLNYNGSDYKACDKFGKRI